MALFQQNFNVADGTSPTTLGFTEDRTSGSITPIVQSGILGPGGLGNSTARYIQNTGSSDHYVQAKWIGGNASGHAMIARYKDSNNYTYLRITAVGATSLRLYKKVAGTSTFVTISLSISYTSNDVFKLDIEGTTRKVYQNTNLIFTDDLATEDATGATYAGFQLIMNTSDGVFIPTMDDYESENLGELPTVYGALTSLTSRPRLRTLFGYAGHLDDSSITADAWVDYDSGLDTNDGSQANPFKHDPDGADATDNALAFDTTNKVIQYKSGVRYRGTTITPRHSGSTRRGRGWGTGIAIFDGADALSGTVEDASSDTVLASNPQKANIKKIADATEPNSAQFLRQGLLPYFIAQSPNPLVLAHCSDTREFAANTSLEYVDKDVTNATFATYDVTPGDGGTTYGCYQFSMPLSVTLLDGYSAVGLPVTMMCEPNFQNFDKTILAQDGNLLTIGGFPPTSAAVSPGLADQPDNNGSQYYRVALSGHPMLIRKPGQFAWYEGYWYFYEYPATAGQQMYLTVRKTTFKNPTTGVDNTTIDGFEALGYWGGIATSEDTNTYGRFWDGSGSSSTTSRSLTVRNLVAHQFLGQIKTAVVITAGSGPDTHGSGGSDITTIEDSVFFDLFQDHGSCRCTSQDQFFYRRNLVLRSSGTQIYCSGIKTGGVIENNVGAYFLSPHGGMCKLYSNPFGMLIQFNHFYNAMGDAINIQGPANADADGVVNGLDLNTIIQNNVFVSGRQNTAYPQYGSNGGVTFRRNTQIYKEYGRSWGGYTYRTLGVCFLYGSTDEWAQDIKIEDNVFGDIFGGTYTGTGDSYSTGGNLFTDKNPTTDPFEPGAGLLTDRCSADTTTPAGSRAWMNSAKFGEALYGTPVLGGEAMKSDGTYSGALFPDGSWNDGSVYATSGTVYGPFTITVTDSLSNTASLTPFTITYT